MDVVAITRLATSVEDEARALAAELGTLPYEQRLKLNAGVPAIVLSSPDEARARALHEALRSRGHDVVHCRTSDVVATEEMRELRRFHFEADALVATQGEPARLPWSDIAVLVRAIHRTSVEHQKVVSQKRFDPVRAALTGGLVMRKATSQTLARHREDTEAVLYVFPRTGGTPWSLRERRAQYEALGDTATTSSLRNFELVVEELRTRARHAAFDDRLVGRKGAPADVDLLAHLIASSRAEGTPSPFR